MAVVLIDGFDLYNGTGANTGLQTKWTTSVFGTGAAMSLTTGRFGGQALRCTISASGSQRITAYRPWASATDSVSIGFAFRKSILGDSFPILWLTDITGATFQVGLVLNANGSLTAGRFTAIDTFTTLGTSAIGVIGVNTWHYIEVEITISDTVGVFNVYVDNASVLSLTGQDTRNGTPTTVGLLMLGAYRTATGTAADLDFDDGYVRDSATRLGERRVEVVRPSADTAQKDFARSSGSDNFALVDDTTANGDTDYVQGSTVGNLDLYTHGGLSSTPTTVDAVQVTAFAEKTDATTRAMALSVKSSSTSSDGSNFTLAASYGKFDRIIEADPATGVAWTASGVNNLQFGPKVTV